MEDTLQDPEENTKRVKGCKILWRCRAAKLFGEDYEDKGLQNPVEKTMRVKNCLIL